MSHSRQLVKKIHKFYKQQSKKFRLAIKKQIIWLLRTLFVPKRRRATVNAGFVLPTVVMVALVVVLLTTAIMFRSFDRSKNASNVRVNEAVLNAATPALERAKSKINKLFQDPRLPRSTPSDLSLYQIITDNINQFTFGDETQLKLVFDVNGDGSINPNPSTLDETETLTTAWKYPVDTNNDGKLDSYTLYGIYFRAPISDRTRSPLEARTPPMDENDKGSQCNPGATTSAQLVGSQGWFKRGGILKKSVFVYTTTVPITDTTGFSSGTRNNYQTFTGNKGFAALEYQQDRGRVSISNNAVVYNDDLQISPGGGLFLNGRVSTNSNLLTGVTYNPITFYLVSSPQSCYYNAANSKIVIGGNVANGRVTDASSDINSSGGVRADFFKQAGPGSSDYDSINSTNKTVTGSATDSTLGYGSKIAYNSQAYEMRIKLLTDAAMSVSTLPMEVSQGIQQQQNADPSLDATTVKRDQLELYFRKRTRRVPYAEVDIGQETAKALKNPTTATDYTTSNVLQVSTDPETLRPPDYWMFPYDPSDGTTETNYANLPIKTNSSDKTKIYLPASATTLPEPQGDEAKIGDRVLVGNNLPEFWWNGTKFVSQQDGLDGGQPLKVTISGTKKDTTWDAGNGTRRRFPQVHQLDDLGVTNRDNFWEKSATQKAQGTLDVVGGLRVITGAGIYKRSGSLPTPTAIDNPNTSDVNESVLPVVWSDAMPMWYDTNLDGIPQTTEKSDLVMRTTVVYHYQTSYYDSQSPSNYQTPIACVSSYYDPSTSQSATNQSGFPDVRLRDTSPNTVWSTTGLTTNRNLTGLGTVALASAGKSNNGVTYQFSGAQASSISGISISNGVFSYASGAEDPTNSTIALKDRLSYQANLVFPNGNFANQPLRNGLTKISQSKSLTLSEQSAVDSAICALELVDSSSMTKDDSVIPHGAIRETAFLDARQIKAIDKPGHSTSYDIDVEQRQPLEIRATVLDLDLLRRKGIGTGEFLLPNSGVIYATRDDALPDQSNPGSLDISATDFTLDPMRRPNGIMLINGSDISRNATYKPEEKGLILATNLPVYIQGNFNTHSQQEFDNTTYNENLASDWSNFYTRTHLNSNFACRNGQFTGCNPGESWRPATVISDAITILSNNFREGFRNEGDYDLRDNWGNSPLGYDYDGVSGIGTNQVSIDERTVQFDLDGDGSTTTTSVSIAEQNIPSVVTHRLNGFWNNNFVTSFAWNGDDSGNSTDVNSNPTKSSYFNNFVTPIQRRTSFPEYVMEICRKPAISACQPGNWVVGYDADGDGKLDKSEQNLKSLSPASAVTDLNGNGSIDTNFYEKDVTANQLVPNSINYTVNKLGAGTTARPALNTADRRYPRRVAFLRDPNGNLILDTSNNPIPLGILHTTTPDNDNPTVGSTDDNNGQVNYYPYILTKIPNTPAGTSYPAYSSTNRPRLHQSNLWFKTNNNLTANYGSDYPLWIANSGLTNSRPTDQPLLIPVLQIQNPFGGSGGNLATLNNTNNIKDTGNNWLQSVTDTTTETNLAFVQGDVPGRPSTSGSSGETNGGLENFVRYLENWSGKNHKVAGAFIQYKRSSYATAPWQTFISLYSSTTGGYSSSTTNFGYPQGYRITVTNDSGVTFGRTPFFIQPNRAWGFDVALLTQLPDLFSQRFTSPSAGDPNEFYREVGRDDAWVQTLLCAAQPSNYDGNFGTAPSTKYGSNFNYAISNDQRPTSCRNAS